MVLPWTAWPSHANNQGNSWDLRVGFLAEGSCGLASTVSARASAPPARRSGKCTAVNATAAASVGPD
eukprot:8245405-Pyramimonas_sp.AAC.1